MTVNVVHTNKNLIPTFILFKKYEGQTEEKEQRRQMMGL